MAFLLGVSAIGPDGVKEMRSCGSVGPSRLPSRMAKVA